MIKILACICMLVDHVGLTLFPSVTLLRIIGRLSMPLFAYSIARGYFYSSKNGSLNAYKIRMLVFALVSQLPYMLMQNEIRLNIGFLWLLCLIFIELSERINKSRTDYVIMGLIVIIVALVPMDYGLYGFCFTLMLYYFRIKQNSDCNLLLSYITIHAVHLLLNLAYGLMQLFTIPAIPLLDLLKGYDNKLRVNKKFFYCFYPIHMSVLVLIRYFIHPV